MCRYMCSRGIRPKIVSEVLREVLDGGLRGIVRWGATSWGVCDSLLGACDNDGLRCVG